MLLRQRVRLFKEAFPWARVFRAHLHLHEYEAKNLLKMAHVDVQPFVVVDASMDRVEAESIVKTLAAAYPNDALVVKAQVLAGGRGKGRFPESGLHGGVKVTKRYQPCMRLFPVLMRPSRFSLTRCSISDW